MKKIGIKYIILIHSDGILADIPIHGDGILAENAVIATVGDCGAGPYLELEGKFELDTPKQIDELAKVLKEILRQAE